MNEKANTELIRTVYAAFNAGDIATVLSHVADDAQFHDQGTAAIPYAGSYNGKAEIMKFFQAMAESTMDGEVVPQEFVAQGVRVIGLGRFRATVRATGSRIDSPIAHVFTVRGGRIASWEGYSDTAAVAAAHMPQSASAGR